MYLFMTLTDCYEYVNRVTHKPGNLEYSGISLNMENSEFCATSMKNCNKESIFSSSFKYLCKTAVDWVNRIIRNRDEVTMW